MGRRFFLEKLEDIRETFVDLLGEIDELVEDADIDQQVSLGQLLWALRGQVGNRIEPLKDGLRAVLTTRHPAPGTVKVAGAQDDHCMTITIPQSRYVLRKGVDLESLREALGDDFHRLFREKTTYTPIKPAIEKAFREASPEKRKALLRALNQVSETARISFRD
jgi:hypothetical protein